MALFDFVKKKNISSNFEIVSPVTGKLITLDDVPDEMFRQRALGEGVAVDPTNNNVVAPSDGVLQVMFETGHAFVVELDNKAQVLVHVGIETVALNGEGFKVLKKQGSHVKKGEPIIEVDFGFIKSKNLSPIVPIIMLDPGEGDKEYFLDLSEPKDLVNKGEDIVIKGEYK